MPKPTQSRLESDGEDIGVLEIPFAQALEMINTAEIVDGKTIMLLQYAQINCILDEAVPVK